jgi:hypothetical protein
VFISTGMVPLLWKWHRTNGGAVYICPGILCILSGVVHWSCPCCRHASLFPGKVLYHVNAMFVCKSSDILYLSSVMTKNFQTFDVDAVKNVNMFAYIISRLLYAKMSIFHISPKWLIV